MKNKFYQYIQNLSNNFILKSERLKFICFVFCAICFLGTASVASAQNLEKDSILIQSFIVKGKKQKSTPTILTISEKTKVNLISNYIDQKILEKQKKEEIFKENYNKLLGRRYLNGDKSVAKEIIILLENRNHDNIKSLFDEMTLEYADRQKGLVLDETIKTKIFKLIEDADLEYSVIQFLGFNRIEGSVELFENRLISGNSSDSDRLFYWIAEEAKSERAIDYIYKSYFDNSLDLTASGWITNGIYSYLQNGSANSKKKILDICYDFIKKNPLKKESIKPKSNDYLPYNDNRLNLKLFGLVLEFGDERNKVLLNNLLEEFKNDENFSMLENGIKLSTIREGNDAEKIKTVKELLQTKSFFFDVLDFIKKDTFLFKNLEIDKSILTTFERLSFKNHYDMERLTSFFKGKDIVEFNNLVTLNIVDKSLKEELIDKFNLDNQTFNEINNYLYKNGIIDSLISANEIEIYSKKEFASPELNSIHTCLEIANISINFDTEPNFIPVDYDVLLKDFVSISKNKINGLKCFLQTKWEEKEEKVHYEFLVVYQDKCYVMIPEDFGDWYDIETFENLLKLIVKDSNIKEEFVSINTGDQTASYIFGEREKIEILKKEFQLETEYIEE